MGDIRALHRARGRERRTWCVCFDAYWGYAGETAEISTGTGRVVGNRNGEGYLSLQLPGVPTVPEQRMMMLVVRELPAQKLPPLAGQMKDLVTLLLWKESAVSSWS